MRYTDDELQMLIYTAEPVTWAHEVVEPAMGIVMDPWQLDFLEDRSKAILLNCHRQSGKSLMTAVKALHTALFRDGSLTVLFSPTQKQSNELFRKIRDLIHLIPSYEKMLKVDNITSLELTNGSRVESLPATNWTVRGYTADLVVIDEAAGVDDRLYAAVSPMLLERNGQFIQMSTPHGKLGRFWEDYNRDTWKKYEVRASQNPRMQAGRYLESLGRPREELGSRIYSQEYECRFLGDQEGSIFKRAWFRYTDVLPEGGEKVRFWDLAATAADLKKGNDPDWTAGVLMNYCPDTGQTCIEDVVHFRGSPHEVEQMLTNVRNRDGPYVHIRQEQEGGSSGKIVTAAFARTIFRGCDYVARSPVGKGDKLQRASPFAAALERGDVSFLRADWNREYEDELCAFPLGPHDDMVDATSGAYTEVTEYQATANAWVV
jgi:predicted phage terminase large subunit-like protein